MNPHWTRQIAQSLATGRLTSALETHLDVLLVWLSNPDNPRAAELEQAIVRQPLSRAQAAASAYRLLDRLLFETDGPSSSDRLGLVIDGEPAIAKQRYRRLMRVYHPDRHPDRVGWATQRTERINRAFKAVRHGVKAPAGGAGAGGSRRVMDRPVWHPEALLGAIVPAWDWTRHRYARLARGQRWWLAGGGLMLLLMLVLLLQGEEPPKPVPRIIHHPLATPSPSRPPVETVSAAEPSLSARNPIETSPPLVPEARTSSLEETAASARAEGIQPESPGTPDQAEPPELGMEEGTATEKPPDVSPRSSPVGVLETSTPKVADPSPSAPAADEVPASPPVMEPPGATLDEEPVAATEPSAVRREPIPRDWTSSSSPDATPPFRPRLGIPPAAPPAQPAPPTPPEPPLRLGAATVPSPLVPEVAVTLDDCQGIPDVLQRFQRAYQSGALDQFMALYSPLARENELATWFAIRETYAIWFSQTSARRIRLERIQIQPITASARCALKAVFSVIYLDQESRLATKAGIIEMLFERQGDAWRILRVRY